MSPKSHDRNLRNKTLAVIAGTVVVVAGGTIGYRQVTGGGGSGYPDASNTGYVHTGVTLTEYTGPNPITTNGTVIDSKHFGPEDCRLVVDADNVTIKRSFFECNEGHAAIDMNSGGGTNVNLLVEDVEVDCADLPGSAVIDQENYTLRRVHAYGCENTVWAQGDVLIEDSYLHDNLPSTTPGCPIEGDPPEYNCHTDGIQVPDDDNGPITIIHNTVYGGYIDSTHFGNSAIGVAASVGSSVIDVEVTNNLMAGGGYTFYCPGEDGGFVWNNNRFSRIYTTTVGGYGPIYPNCAQHDHSGNVIHETGESLD